MRKVAHALPLGLVFVAACASSPDNNGDDGTTPMNGDGSSDPTTSSSQDGSDGSGMAANPGSSGSQDLLDQEAELLTLKQQKNRLLFDRHMASARDLVERLRFDEAAEQAAAALAINGDSLEAKTLMAEISGLMGSPTASQAATAQDLSNRYELRIQALRSEARDSFSKAKVMLARGDYDAAIAELNVTLNHVQWAPYQIDWNGMDTEAAELLERAKLDRSAAAEKARDDARRRAYDDLKAQREAELARKEAVVDNLVEDAIQAFALERYNEAERLAKEALKKDPRHEKAEEVRDASYRAGRLKVREDYIVRRNEEFKRWREDLAEKLIPWTDPVTLPDEEYWAHITELRADLGGAEFSSVENAADLQLRSSLRSSRIPGLQIEDVDSLRQVVDVVRTLTGLPLIVDEAAETAAFDEGALYTYNLNNALTAEQALNIITADSGEEVTWTVRHEAVIVTTKENARGEPTIKSHDVQDLVFALTDFLGPRIDRLRLLEELEDDDGGSPFGTVSETITLIDMSTLVSMIQENVAVDSWDEDGVSISEGETNILVVHSPEVQQQVAQFLDDLRRFSSSLVTIESKFMSISSLYLQEIGVDFRGLDNPGSPFTDLDDVTNGLEDMASRGLDNGGTGAAGAGGSGPPSPGFFFNDGADGDVKGRLENFFNAPLGNMLSNVGGLTFQLTYLNDAQISAILRAVEKRTEVQLVNDQLLSVHNSQRAYVSVINQRAYVQDFDVEVAQFQAVADPQVNVLTEGVVLDVRPTIHHDRKYLTLEIQPTVANVVALRPFSTTLGGNTSPVEFQLPELEVQSVFTTAVIPDGGSILLGGLSNIRSIERRAELPWVAKIPVVGFLFKSEGYNDENESLMILIRARITDVKEELDRLERKMLSR